MDVRLFSELSDVNKVLKLILVLDNRGFMTANGQPDQARSARYVLKDYVNGKLLFCYAPPGVEQKQYHTYPDRVRDVINEKTLPPQQQRAMRVNNDLDLLIS